MDIEDRLPPGLPDIKEIEVIDPEEIKEEKE